MLFFFDESGDFAFPEDRFDSYTQAAVICPESEIAGIEAFVQDRCARWNVSELHATRLTPGQRIRIRSFIADSNVQLVVQATDTDIVTPASISAWRARQAETIRRNLAWYRDQGGSVPEIEAWMAARAKGSEHTTRVSDSEFVQLNLVIELIFEALQKSLIVFSDDAWRNAFEDFRFILDGKLTGKLGPGEKYLQHILVPTLGSDARFALDLVDSWRDAQPPHPFIARYEKSEGWSGARRARVVEDVIDLSGIFAGGLEFEDSGTHPASSSPTSSRTRSDGPWLSPNSGRHNWLTIYFAPSSGGVVERP